MKVLIINSDAPNNRGDRAILAGNIKLIQDIWPDANIWALSEYAKRDSEWYGINFLSMSAYSVNPIKFLQLVNFSRNCDYIFWGGGELLKDYTNKLGVLYWIFKILPITALNKQVYGMFQGIGPTESNTSKKMIAFLVNRTQAFLVRDKKSEDKLSSWGVKIPVIASYDPAIVANNHKPDKNTFETLQSSFDIDKAFLDNCVGIGPRKWFHYRKSGWIPFKFRFWEKQQPEYNQRLTSYIQNLVKLCDWIVETHNTNLLFLPMHMSPSENDALFSEEIIKHMKHKEHARIVDKDILSPHQYHSLVSRCRLFIGIRLHSSILAATANVPTMVFYYVDKGRLFFEQLDMQNYSYPIEDLLDQHKLPEIEQKISSLLKKQEQIKRHLNKKITTMRKSIYNDFRSGINS